MTMSRVVFKSFSSGSCGNCYFLGLEEEGRISAGVIIDAGVSIRRVKKELLEDGYSLDDISAILVTHDHVDHIRNLSSFCNALHLPVWASGSLHKALSKHMMTYATIPQCRRILQGGAWTDVVEGKISVHYFIVPHDASQTAGFAIRLGGMLYVHITDCGRMIPEALEYCAQADTVVLESNYDDYMLDHGPYPQELRDRIRNGHGHLSNAECDEAIRAFAGENLKHLLLCHLSENNNTPELAYSGAKAALESTGCTGVRLQALPRRTPSKLIILSNE